MRLRRRIRRLPIVLFWRRIVDITLEVEVEVEVVVAVAVEERVIVRTVQPPRKVNTIMSPRPTTRFGDRVDRVIRCAICSTLLNRRENLRLRHYHISGGGPKVA